MKKCCQGDSIFDQGKWPQTVSWSRHHHQSWKKFWPKTFIKVKNKKEEGEKQEVVKVQTVDNYLLMNTSPITAQSEQGTWATVEGVAQRQNKPCRMSFVERATFRAVVQWTVYPWTNFVFWRKRPQRLQNLETKKIDVLNLLHQLLMFSMLWNKWATEWSPQGHLWQDTKSLTSVSLSGLYIDPRLRWSVSKVGAFLTTAIAFRTETYHQK